MHPIASTNAISYFNIELKHRALRVNRSEDPRVGELADEIIKVQRREIKEMKWLVADIRANGVATNQAETQARPVPEFSARPE